MFILNDKAMLIQSYEEIIKGNLKPKPNVYTELQMFVMFGALDQADMDRLIELYPQEDNESSEAPVE
ncbi:hypothetical protein [Anaeromicrobium sediminis]|uniref:Uncharacterized protein n=1 Tax=Anaeromicrobium sediminis TaxID=1478221 RepID=A0A267MRB6_9FIRM|nr:hypothetical protein [Anaeromicrobium sediminis]PAB61313.1 hypothetical protein CCE28_02455 [Anaeromicrobium sediminis]